MNDSEILPLAGAIDACAASIARAGDGAQPLGASSGSHAGAQCQDARRIDEDARAELLQVDAAPRFRRDGEVAQATQRR